MLKAYQGKRVVGFSAVVLVLLAAPTLTAAEGAPPETPAAPARMDSAPRALVPPRAPGVSSTEGASAAVPQPMAWRVWPLFDPFVSRREVTMRFGHDTLRDTGAARLQDGLTVALGQSLTTFRPGLWVRLDRRIQLRFTRRSTYMLELSSYDYLAGVRLPWLELGGGVGVVPVGMDTSRGDFSLSVLSPRAVATMGLALGPVRFSLDLFQQYTWRVWGGNNAWIRGFSVQLAATRPVVKQRGNRPIVLLR